MNSDICKLKCSSFSQTETLLFYYSSLYFSFVPFEIGEWLMVWRKNSIASSLSHATTIFHQKIKKNYIIAINYLSFGKRFTYFISVIVVYLKTLKQLIAQYAAIAWKLLHLNTKMHNRVRFSQWVSIDGILDKWTPNNKYHIPFVQKGKINFIFSNVKSYILLSAINYLIAQDDLTIYIINE